jgi:mono/diheme cytochrome c family protein
MKRLVQFAVFAIVGSGAYLQMMGEAPQAQGVVDVQGSIPNAGASASTDGRSPNQELVARYCLSCHNDRLKTGGVSLASLNPESPASSAPVWEKVIRKLRSGAMPPPGLPRPAASAVSQLLSSLVAALDAEAARNPNPGRPAVHRLNRTEYQNAIRDLLQLEIDSRTLLPADDQDHGFDNLADVLSVSPTLVERYQSAAQKLSRLAIGDPSTRPTFETVQVPERLVQDDRTSDDQPFGSRGGITFKHTFSLDGEYVVRVKLRRTLYDYIRGLGLPHKMDIRVDGKRVGLLTVGGALKQSEGQWPPETNSGNYIGDPKWEAYSHTADDNLEVRFPGKAGSHLIGVSFDKGLALPDGILDRSLDVATFRYASDEMQFGNPAISSVSVGGPFNVAGTSPPDSPSRKATFSCVPRPVRDAQAGEKCARQIFATLARRAYRRDVSKEDIDTLMAFYARGVRAEPDRGFEAGLQLGLERLLTDPDFIFRIETDPETGPSGKAYRLSDVALASRLSFFLWSSIPDQELLDVAIHGQLKDPAVLERQVKRMLADPRSSALPINFGGQWLDLRLLRAVNPDEATFPEFDENLRSAMQQETELFLQSQVREDRGIVEMLAADYTYLNERLASHYGVPDIYGVHMRRVHVDDVRRRGLLGQASLMTVTSYPNRTSPVLRGKWLLEKFLGAPPPEPPPNVPALPERGPTGESQSVRRRLEEHRKNSVCASCHRTIDPMGFALENFDAIGRWRNADDGGLPGSRGEAIDPQGVLPDGTSFSGVAELRQLLVTKRKTEFVLTVVEQLLTYALGRGLEYYDMPAVRNIVKQSEVKDYSWSSVILAIVKSAPFQMRRTFS